MGECFRLNEKVRLSLKTYLSTRPEVELAIVFGSQAKGTATEASDVDVALSIGRRLSPEDYSSLVLGLSNACGKEVDLIDLWTADYLISRLALTEGSILMEKDPQIFAGFLKRALFDEADLGPARTAIQTARRKKVFDVG